MVWLPSVAGNGFEPLNVILDQRMALTTVSLLLVGKVLATSASVGSGIPGGIFTPMLLLGAALGTLVAHAFDRRVRAADRCRQLRAGRAWRRRRPRASRRR